MTSFFRNLNQIPIGAHDAEVGITLMDAVDDVPDIELACGGVLQEQI